VPKQNEPTTTAVKVMAPNLDDMQDLIAATVGDDGLDDSIIPLIKIPSGGLNVWMVPGSKGLEAVQEITGVVIHWQRVRSYWDKGFGEGEKGAPPECASDDGIVGTGTPGGDCKDCPLSAWPDDDSPRRGKACTEMINVFIVPVDGTKDEGEIIPLRVRLSPMSLKPWRQYMGRLLSKKNLPWNVVTTMALGSDTNAQGQEYAKLVVGEADQEADESWIKFGELMRPALMPPQRVPRLANDSAE